MKRIFNSQVCAILVFFKFFLSEAFEQTVTIPNTSNGKVYKALVVFPDIYKKGNNRFPAIFLLHGYSGNYRAFSKIVDLEEYADTHGVILVCPDGNYNSWYINSPIKKKSQFRSYIINDVIPYIDANFRTLARTEARAIIGTSMGGHGSLTLLLQHPSLFCGAGSISGILDLTKFPEQWDLEKILGNYSSHKNNWEKNSFVYLIELFDIRDKYILVDCGKGDFALSVNRDAHQKMLSLGINHRYFERDGKHDYNYVKNVLGHHIAFFSQVMKK
ncbi:MAG: alpha/beta hydrolase family protein [Chitinispirillia bacterium]|jgi:S-formylglutathione hydrolase FrmB